MTKGPRIDEGYIKFECEHSPGPPPDTALVSELNAVRAQLFRLGLVGHDTQHDVDFGNLSMRLPRSGAFIITGTQTGHREVTTNADYAIVRHCDAKSNRVVSTGPVQPSSETLTHAACYALDPEIRAVVHVHSRRLWERLRDDWPTTRADVAYGTPAMAAEMARLYTEADLRRRRLAVMAGHPDGLISFGVTPAQAAAPLLAALSG